jgi:hypothetical protein
MGRAWQLDPFMQITAARAGWVGRQIEVKMSRPNLSDEDIRMAIGELAVELRLLAEIVVHVAGDIGRSAHED